jgi:hypothetical protein
MIVINLMNAQMLRVIWPNRFIRARIALRRAWNFRFA